MDGPLRRLRTRRAATADESPPDTSAASEPVDGTAPQPTKELGPVPAGASHGAEAADDPEARERAAREEELRRRARDLPAGVDLAELEQARSGSPRRGALRKRARYLRRVRELLLRDLGGFFYEVHRTAGGQEHRGHREILETKAARLTAVDAELRELQTTLGDERPAGTVVREPGVGGACPECGELHGSDARYCSHCGTPLSERARRDLDRTIAERARVQEEQRRAAAAAAEAAQRPAAEAPTGELGARGADQEPVGSERTP